MPPSAPAGQQTREGRNTDAPSLEPDLRSLLILLGFTWFSFLADISETDSCGKVDQIDRESASRKLVALLLLAMPVVMGP